MQQVKIRDQNGKLYNRKLLLIALLASTFFEILNETLLATAYPKLMSYFNVSTSTVQWLTSAFLMTAGIMIPISTWLMERINTKKLFISSMIIFLIGTILAWFAPNFQCLLIARIIQAVSTGIGMPLFQSIIFYIYPRGQRGIPMGMGSIILGGAPAIGPSLSGWIIDNANWRDLFAISAIPTFLLIFVALAFIRPVLPTHKAKIDVPSVLLSTLGFGSLLYGFSSVGQHGWTSNVVIISLIIGIIFVAFFIWRELVAKHPLIDLDVFKNYQFNIGTIAGSLTMMALVGFEMVLPLYLQTLKNDSAFQSGLTLLPGALMIIIIGPLTGTLMDKHGVRNLAISGFMLLSLGTLPFLFLTKSTPTIYIIFLYAVRSIGIAMSLMTITTYSMNYLPKNQINNGSSATNTVKQVASAIATAILTSILSNVTKIAKPAHHMLNTEPLRFKNDMISAGMTGYHSAFAVALLFCIIGLIFTFWIKDGKNRKEESDND